VKNIEAHNARTNETYKRGVSSHSDLSYKEKVFKRMGIAKTHKEPNPKMQPKQVIKNIVPPKEGGESRSWRALSLYIFVLSVNYTRFFPPIKSQVKFFRFQDIFKNF
jgi:hypothetical protein